MRNAILDSLDFRIKLEPQRDNYNNLKISHLCIFQLLFSYFKFHPFYGRIRTRNGSGWLVQKTVVQKMLVQNCLVQIMLVQNTVLTKER